MSRWEELIDVLGNDRERPKEGGRTKNKRRPEEGLVWKRDGLFLDL